MEDGVKFIFRTLIKVPCIIMASFFVFNIFAFAFTYFKLLGFSYVVMQTAVENNYIPDAERATLTNYLNRLADTAVIDDAGLILVGNSANESNVNARKKRQYGSSVTVGVYAHYKPIWPLSPRDQLQNTNETFIGLDNGSSFSGYADGTTLEQRRENVSNYGLQDIQATGNQDAMDAGPAANGTVNYIVIKYTVPGLKYYPDLT